MKISIILLFSFLILFGNVNVFGQQKSSIEIQIKDWSGDLIDVSQTMLVIYQDNVELKTLSLASNPQIITDIPPGHNYNFEIIRNGIHVPNSKKLFLNSDFEKLILVIPSAGGIKFKVLYNDNSPIPDATVTIKSTQGSPIATAITNDQGETQRYWLQATNLDEFYFADVTIGTGISYIYSPVKISPDAQRDFKIITPWPSIIDDLITVSVIKENQKVSNDDGKFLVEVYDKTNKKIKESVVNLRDEAYFSNIPVGEYTFKTLRSNTQSDAFELWGSMKTVLTGSEKEIILHEGRATLKLEKSGCNCVAFRLDDVQDYSLNQAQMEVIDLFQSKNADLSIGVIGGLIGEDSVLVNFLKERIGKSEPILEIASHSWNNSPMTSFSKEKQDSLIKNTNQQIKEVLGVTPVSFIPPENVFNQDTLDVLQTNGFTHLSSSFRYDTPPFPITDSEFYRFPQGAQTAVFDSSANLWIIEDKETILNDVISSVNNYGYAVVMMHPPDFSIDDNGIYRNEVVQKQIEELSLVIDEIRNLGLEIKPISKINLDSSKINKSNLDNIVNSQINNNVNTKCNCVAFTVDELQDYWLNDVQIKILKIFEKTQSDLTIGVIGNHFGSDEKLINYLKGLLQNTNLEIEIANNGWEYEDYTKIRMSDQVSSIKKGNEKIEQILGVKAETFLPPFDKFNGDTVLALKSTGMSYLSSSKFSELPPNLEENGIEHIPYGVTTSTFEIQINQYVGINPEESFKLIAEDLQNQGFSVVRINPLEFSTIADGNYENTVKQNQLDNLEFLIEKIKEERYDLVVINQIPQNTQDQIEIPSWIKNNAGWWADSQIDDTSFVQGIQYMIKNGIMRIPTTQSGSDAQTNEIPPWIRNNAGWWSEDLISDNDFVGGIEYMIKTGVIKL